jgi:CelD/BcsL family acetyltransferase involved in cellulose biosynthesis
MATTYRLVSCQELDAGLINAWREILFAAPEFSSPYFSPEFTQLVGSVRSDVRIVVIEDDRKPVGFFPHQRSAIGFGKPVGGPLSDFHGVIAAPEAEWDLESLLLAARLHVWTYDHLIGDTCRFDQCIVGQRASPQIDLSMGFQSYLEGRRKSGSAYIGKTEGLARKLAREQGDLHFTFHDTGSAVLEQLIQWKREQYYKTGIADVFEFPWTTELLRKVAATQTSAFSGLCSVLRVGNRIVAIHVGMRTPNRLHYWFPAYDPEFAKFSPGIALLMRIAEAGAADGVRTIDLGAGDSQYKERLMTNAIVVRCGVADRPSFLAKTIRIYRRAETLTSSGRWPIILGLPVRAIRRLNRFQRFR